MSSVYLASKFDNEVFLQTFGAIVVLLSILFTISLIVDIKKKAEKKDNNLVCYFSASRFFSSVMISNGLGLITRSTAR
jgi:hypothetical protein